MQQCEICHRQGADEYFEKHHLYPGKRRRVKTGRNETITVCHMCGDQIHNMFNNNILRRKLNKPELLAQAMFKYIRWVEKKPIEFHTSMKT